MTALVRLFIASYRVDVLRALLVLLAIVFACAGLTAVLVLNTAAQKSYQDAAQPLVEGVNHQVVAKPLQRLTKSDYTQLRRDGFTQLLAVQSMTVSARLQPQGNPSLLTLLGLDSYALLSATESVNFSSEDANSQAISAMIAQPLSTFIHSSYAQELGLKAGQEITLQDGHTLPPLSIVEAAGLGRQLVLDIGALQASTAKVALSELWVIGEIDTQKLDAALPDHLQRQQLDVGEDATRLTDSFHLNLLAMALLMFVVCMFVVLNALNLLLGGRLKNLIICRQLGVSRKAIYALVVLELVVLCLCCAPLGTWIGIQFAQLLSPAVMQTLSGLYGVHVGYGQVSFLSLSAQALLASLLGVGLASSFPLWRLNARLTSTKDNRVTERQDQWWWLLCGLLLASAGAIYVSQQGLIASLVVIALLLLAGCCFLILTLPRLLRGVFAMLPVNWPLIRWSVADAVKVSRLSKIAFSAFFIAVAANIGMNIMVNSFRAATELWLEQRLHAQAYLWNEHPQELLEWVEHQNLAVDILPRYAESTLLHEQMVEIRSFPVGEQHRKGMVFYRASEDVWDHFDQQTGLLISQQLAYRFGYTLDQELRFSHASGSETNMPIKGIYYDYGNPKAQITLAPGLMANWGQLSKALAVFANSEQDLQQAKEHLLGSGRNVSWLSTSELQQLSMRAFDQTFVITSSLNLVTLLVAAFSLATSVLIIDMDNRATKSLINSFGVSRNQLFALAMTQYFCICILACLLALPFGVLLSWLLVNLVNVQAFDWSYPLQISLDSVLTVAAVSLSLMVLVVTWPLIQQRRRPITENLRWLS